MDVKNAFNSVFKYPKFQVPTLLLVIVVLSFLVFRPQGAYRDYLTSFFAFTGPNPQYKVPAFLLVTIITLLLISIFNPNWKKHRDSMALGIVLSASFLLVIGSETARRWEIIVALLPATLVLYQAFFLWLHQPRKNEQPGADARDQEPPPATGITGQVDTSDYAIKANQRALRTVVNQFRVRTLLIRYGFPAVLLGIAGIIILSILVNPAEFFSWANVVMEGREKAEKLGLPLPGEQMGKILLGIKMGSIGAYMYVLLELGRRTFRHDVTGASAMWCLVTLVLGPILAAAVAVLWQLGQPEGSEWWGAGIVLFFAGFAPRRVIGAVEQAAVQLLKIGTQTVVETRLVPLTKIRGISPQIEERLSEEGILDVSILAAAEPVRLFRNTSFDLRQILCWVDEAILMTTLPKSWETFEEEGITGAIDLAWYYDQVLAGWDGSSPPETPAAIKDLALKGKVSELNLVSTIQRLYEDAQVQYIWALYNNFIEHSGGDGNGFPNGNNTIESPL